MYISFLKVLFTWQTINRRLLDKLVPKLPLFVIFHNTYAELTLLSTNITNRYLGTRECKLFCCPWYLP